MNFREAESYLYSLGNEVSAMKLGLDSIRRLLTELGHPERKYLKVQVAGTNGKGSVCAFLDSICNTARIKTGTFTSPHLVSVTERVRINGEDISEDEFARTATVVREASERLVLDRKLDIVPTFFEQITAIALFAFAEANVDVAILETGLGGRLDATTAANAEIAVITRIDYDHQQYLGNTIEEIAGEKAAVITSETRNVVIGEQSSEVSRILRDRCAEFGLKPIGDEYEPWRIVPITDSTVGVDLSLLALPPITLGLKGRHQIENAQTAVQAAMALWHHGAFDHLDHGEGEDEMLILEGLRSARHPGRLEFQGRWLFDGAHNIGGAKALRSFLDEFIERPVTMIFGAMRDKDVTEIGKILFPAAKHLILTEPESPRAMPVNEILRSLEPDDISMRAMTTSSVSEALLRAEEMSDADGIIVITGSLYLVGEAKRILRRDQFQIEI